MLSGSIFTRCVHNMLFAVCRKHIVQEIQRFIPRKECSLRKEDFYEA